MFFVFFHKMADFTLELEALRVENARLKEKLKQHLLVEDMLLPSSSNLPRAVIGMNREGGENACPAPPWIAGLSHSLTAAQIQRYSRQLLLPSFGVKAQENLCKGSVLIVGAGGLGSPVALYLAACGVGCIGIMDPDRVELHNLHRQVIHNEASVGETKVSSASRTCLAINSSVKVRLTNLKAFYSTTGGYQNLRFQIKSPELAQNKCWFAAVFDSQHYIFPSISEN